VFKRHKKYIANYCIGEVISALWLWRCRRVHVSKATLMFLGDEFRVESSEGDSRDSYLVERGIETFFIVPQSNTPQLPANNRVSRV